MNKVPRYIYYIITAIFIMFGLRFITNTYYEQIGYVPLKIHEELSQEPNELDTLTITLEVVSKEINSENIDTSQLVTERSEVYLEQTITYDSNTITKEISNQQYFELLKKNYLMDIIEGLPVGEARKDLVIRYYKRRSDNKAGIDELKTLKYYIHERETGRASENVNINNALVYGENISKEDIQIVAYTLLKNGLPIKKIEPSKFGSGWKSNAIEIANDPSAKNQKILTLADIRSILH